MKASANLANVARVCVIVSNEVVAWMMRSTGGRIAKELVDSYEVQQH
jgi:hypothetical protein